MPTSNSTSVKPLPTFGETRLQLGEPEQVLIHCLPVTRWHSKPRRCRLADLNLHSVPLSAPATIAQSSNCPLHAGPPQLNQRSQVEHRTQSGINFSGDGICCCK